MIANQPKYKKYSQYKRKKNPILDEEEENLLAMKHAQNQKRAQCLK